MNAERCGNCRFYDRENETKLNLKSDEPLHEDDYEAPCRRFPPVRGDAKYFGAMGEMELLRDAYSGPFVQTVAWCGEWQPCANDAPNPPEPPRKPPRRVE
ncbi:MAG: hypothetical protein ACKO0Z_02785 [Betaproteobacteria bacterium]